MSKYQLIDPGIDPTDEPNPPARRGGLLFWLCGAGLAVLVIGYLVIGKSSKAQAANDAAVNDAIAATISALPTATIAPTASPTAQIQGGAWLPDHLRATITPTAGGISTATATPAPLVQTQIVEVTRLVPGPVVPVVTVQVITSTPEPTYTPWIITVVVEVTPTPTETPTPIIWIEPYPIRTIPPFEPREESTITPTSTP